MILLKEKIERHGRSSERKGQSLFMESIIKTSFEFGYFIESLQRAPVIIHVQECQNDQH